MTKILYVNSFNFPDYLNDCIYHGLNHINDLDIETTAKPDYMLKTYENKSSLYGKGFTICATLDIVPKVALDVEQKIKDCYYDFIIFGSIHRDNSYLELALKRYSRDKIICIDGEDHENIIEKLVDKVLYFKRELKTFRRDVFPISFSIPEDKIRTERPSKEKILATVNPTDISTYVFNTEEDYYEDYAKSYYGVTCKKAGWDCMRHYEILANYSVPFFVGIEGCPEATMTNFPKQVVLLVSSYAFKGQIHPEYDQINSYLNEYTLKYLTTTESARRLLR